MSYAARLEHAHRAATAVADPDIADHREVYLDETPPDAADCHRNDCAFIAQCGKVTCIHCGRPA